MGVNGLSVQRYGCEGETSRNCLHHARAAASEPYQPPGFLPTCGDPTPRVAFLSVTWVRCAIFWRKSPATKLFRLISSGNRPPQNCFGSFPQEIGRSLTHSFPQEIGRHLLTHFLRKSPAKNFFISSGNRPLTYSLISSGNRRMAYIELTLSNGPKSGKTAKFSHRKRPVASGAAGLSCQKWTGGRQLFLRSG